MARGERPRKDDRDRYVWILAWGRMMGSNPDFIVDEQKQALADKAPFTACYRNQNGWRLAVHMDEDTLVHLRRYLPEGAR